MTASLSADERSFLRLVMQAAAANPFGPDRPRLDREIAGDGAPRASGESLHAAIDQLTAFMAGLRRAGRSEPTRFAEDDAELLEGAHLFEVFHRHCDRFDALIQSQLETGDGTCPVPFARQALSDMADRGFSDDDCERHLALFYQLRRAYHFIHASLLGTSDCMRELRASLWADVFTMDLNTYRRHLWNRMEDFSTLLLGETGSGKGAAAAAIGMSGFIPYDGKRGCFSESFVRSFVPINLSQFPDTLIESELFGHRKGAFTGAIEAHLGVFARCSRHGAIFLDEIGDVSVPTQIKLLKVLQDRTFCPVGSHEIQEFRGRVIAASNRSINELRESGAFRDDFYYRLCSDVITVPPLRDRIREDGAELPLLIGFIVERILGGSSPAIAATVQEVVVRDLGEDYGWPGNVRELEQCVRRILLRQHVAPDPVRFGTAPGGDLSARIEAGALSAHQLTVLYCARLHADLGSYEAVARVTDLDRRTVKKYVQEADEHQS